MLSKIAFLFLTLDSVYHETAWIRFFSQPAASETYSVYVHSKKSFCSPSFFEPFVMKEKTPTTWANTMNAQIEMLRESLKDQANTKFVFISESTIPIANFEEVYSKILEHPYSQFWYKKGSGGRNFSPLKSQTIYTNSQWIILNREDAELMAADIEILPIMTQHPHDQEHYPSTFLAHHNRLERVVKKDLTFVYWGTDASNLHPYLFTQLADDKATNLLVSFIQNKRFLFARKFSSECDLAALHEFLPELY